MRITYLEMMRAHVDDGGKLGHQNGMDFLTEVEKLRSTMQQACDLLAERAHGNPARSPGHNARVHLEHALKEPAAEKPEPK